MSALAGGKYGKQICGGYYHDGFICVGHFNDGMRLEWSEFVDVGVLNLRVAETSILSAFSHFSSGENRIGFVPPT